jgi:predicted flap endonuclease-1-like 5' DNA nuclease
MLKGFVSYAREDGSEICTDLLRQLAEMEEDGIARFWVDRSLRIGEMWEQRLLHELNKADVIILIVTPRALDPTSYVRTTELPLIAFNIRRKRLLLVPALAKKTRWKIRPLLNAIQACPTPPWIEDPLQAQQRINWAFEVAGELRSALLAAHLDEPDYAKAMLASAERALGHLDAFEGALAKARPAISQRTTMSTIRVIELVRHAIRSPFVDLPEDGVIAERMAKSLHHSVREHPLLAGFASLLAQSIADLLQAAITLRVAGAPSGFDQDHALFASWATSTYELGEVEKATARLQEEIQYLKQTRRFSETSSAYDNAVGSMSGIAERKASIVAGLLEETEVDVQSIVAQSVLLDNITHGFVSSLDIEVDELTPAQADASQRVVASTSHLASVSIAALQKAELLERRSVRATVIDDLKRIRGIGVLIEKRLNAAGVTTYEQIASWGADDIERISMMLDFKERIQKENWVEQARILAAGGFTEFSRRVDRGEVDSSRPKTS